MRKRVSYFVKYCPLFQKLSDARLPAHAHPFNKAWLTWCEHD